MAKIQDIAPGTGKILSIDDTNVAVFNDNGTLKGFSTVCTHAGCEVELNESDNTWDCPCHGSRFGLGGEVQKGPARRPLDQVSLKIDGDEIKLA